jgi:type I restriction enzyme S subunit
MILTTKSIGEISIQIRTGKTPPTQKREYFDGIIRWYTPGDFGNAISMGPSARTITDHAVRDKKATIYDKGTVLISCIGNIGKVGILTSEASCNQQITGIKLKDTIDPMFFAYWCRANKKVLEGKASNAIIPILNNAVLSKISITYPKNIIDQIRIANLLIKTEELIIQKEQNLKQLDELIKSVFFDMFGEPVRNEKQWNEQPLDELLSKIDSGWSPKCEANSAKNNQWGILKLSAVTSGFYKPNENKAMLPKIEPKVQHEVRAGDLLFTRKNTYELVGATAFVHETRPKLLLPDLIFRLVIKDQNEIHPIYLWKLLSYPSHRKKIQSLAGGAAGSMPNISKAKLKTALLPVPNIDLQLKFVEVINKIEAIKSSFKKTIEDLELLYGSLSQKAFKGELDLSAVPLPEKYDEITELSDNESTEINKLQKKLEHISKPLKQFEQITKSFEQFERITKPLKQFEQITKSFEQVERITKPLKHLDQITKSFEAFNLPKTLPDFSKEKTRKKWLIKLFKEFLTDLDQRSFLSLPDFLEAAQNWIGEFEQEDGERLSFLIDDYEALKCWIFNEVRNGTILQIYQEASNSIQFKVSQ